MKPLLTLSVLLLASINLNAQSLNAGLRANASYSMRQGDNGKFKFEAVEGDHLNIAPEVFVRFALKKRWAFEVSFNHSNYRPADIIGHYYEQGQAYDTMAIKYQAVYNELTLSAFYELGCPSLQKSSFLKKLHSYAGVSLGILFSKYESEYYIEGRYGWGGPIPPQYLHSDGTERSVWTGLNYNVTFDLGKRVKLTSGSYFKIRPGLMMDSFSPTGDPYTKCAQFGLQLGASYRIL